MTNKLDLSKSFRKNQLSRSELVYITVKTIFDRLKSNYLKALRCRENFEYSIVISSSKSIKNDWVYIAEKSYWVVNLIKLKKNTWISVISRNIFIDIKYLIFSKDPYHKKEPNEPKWAKNANPCLRCSNCKKK
jgi:hypothetical protein